MTFASGAAATGHKTQVHAHGTKCRSAVLQQRVNVEHRKENRRRHHRRSNALLLGNVQIDEPSARVEDDNEMPFEIPADSVLTQLLAEVINDSAERSSCESESLQTASQSPPPPSPITPSSSMINCSPISSTDEFDDEILLEYSERVIGIQQHPFKLGSDVKVAEKPIVDSPAILSMEDRNEMQIDTHFNPNQLTITKTKSVSFSADFNFTDTPVDTEDCSGHSRHSLINSISKSKTSTPDLYAHDFDFGEDETPNVDSTCDRNVGKAQVADCRSTTDEALPTSLVKDLHLDQSQSAIVLMMHHIHLQEVTNNKHLSQHHSLVGSSASPSAPLQLAFYA